MPITKSATKYVRITKKNRLANRGVKSEILSIRKKLDSAIAGKDLEQSKKLFRDYSSVLDKAAKKSVIKFNNASRKKSRIAIKLAAMSN